MENPQPLENIKCKFFGGYSAKSLEVYIDIHEEGINITDGIVWKFDDLEIIEKPTDGKSSVISCKSSQDSRLHIQDLDLFHFIASRIPKKSAILYIISLIKDNITSLLILLLIVLSAPYLIKLSSQYISQKKLDISGSELLEFFITNENKCSKPSSVKELNKMLNKLTVLSGSDKKYDIYVVKNKSVNAIAIPRSSIIIFSGLLDKVKYANEFAMILGHEIGHIEKEHHRDLYAANILFNNIFSVSTSLLNHLITSKYSRQDEIEADLFAYEFSKKSAIDPQYLVSILEILEKEGKMEGVGSGAEKIISYVSSHPSTNERIEIVKGKISNNKFTNKKIISDESWKEIKNICLD
jgi:Zn-dependent protease with chaperone function